MVQSRVQNELKAVSLCFQVVCMGIFRIIGLFYLGSFDSIVRRCMMQREKSESADKTE